MITDLIVKYATIGFLAGAVAGGLGVYFLQSGPKPTERPQVQEDTTKLAWDELTAGLLPDRTTAYQPGQLTQECMPVPLDIVDQSRPKPDTVTKYRTRFTDVPGPSAPSIEWSSQVGLDVLARSRYPFLYLPLLESGKPAIDHDGQSTTVQAYGQNGRGYTFTYRYRRPTLEAYVQAWADGQWWPPLQPSTQSIEGEAGVDVGLRYKSIRVHAGPQFSTTIGPAVHTRISWTPWSVSR